MTTETRFKKLLSAVPVQLALVNAVVEGKVTVAEVTDTRLLTFSGSTSFIEKKEVAYA